MEQAVRRPALWRAAFLVPLAFVLWGCGPKFIQGTEIEDNETNRAVLRLVEEYRRAVESRDTDALRALMSERYYENGSTTDRDDDDYGPDAVLKKVLPLLSEHVEKVFYQVRVTRIRQRKDAMLVDYQYILKFRYTDGDQARWGLRNDVNELELVKEHGAWKIVSGM